MFNFFMQIINTCILKCNGPSAPPSSTTVSKTTTKSSSATTSSVTTTKTTTAATSTPTSSACTPGSKGLGNGDGYNGYNSLLNLACYRQQDNN